METFTICVSSHRKNSQDVEFKVTVNNTATVTEVLLKALELTNLYRKEDQDYALSVEKDARKPLALATKVNSLQTRKLYLTQILFKITVYIMQNQQEQLFGLSPLMTVSEAVQFIEQSNFTGANYNILSDHLKSRTPSHELFLVTTTDQTSTTAKGIPLDFNRTLRSYRVTPLDTLVLSKAQNRNHVWTDIIENEGDKQIAVIVSSDEFSCSKAFKVPITATFQEVLCMFIERTNQVILHRFFTLALDMKGTPGEMMDMENEVGSYPLPTPARLKCVAKPRPAQTVFGVDPTTLPLVNDMGVDVPEIVVILRDMLLLLDPFEQEGIFRKAGNETEMKKMIKDFNAGRPVQSTDIHSVATLLKRWFKDLPKRLFSHIHKSILDDEERLRNIYDELSPMESALTKWLFELLVDISKNSDVNKMIPSNLGIVFGPGVFGSSTFDASSALNAISLLTSDSKTGQEIIEKSISYLLEHPEHRPLKPEKPLKSTIVESSYQSAGATSGAPMPMGLPPVVIDFSSDSKMAQMLARRRQMVEGEIAAPVIEPTKPKKPALGSSFPRQAFALRPTPPATTANETQNNTTGGNARVKSMMLPGGGMNIQNELKNRIAIGQAGLKKFEPRQPPPNPTQQEAGPPGFKRASQPNVGQITRPNFRATPSPPYRESSTNQPQTSENSPTQPSNGEESSTPERKPHKIATVENRPKNVKYPPAPPPRPARARPVSVAPNKMYSRNPSIPSRSVDSKTLFPHLQAAREKPTLTPPSRPLAARPKLVPELPKKPATAPPSRPNRRTLPPKMFKQPNRPPPQAPDSDPLPGSAEEPPHVVSDSPSSTAPVPVPVPAPKPTPDVPKQPEVVEIQVSKPMEPEPEPVEEPESVKPEPVKPELQEKIEQLVASMEAEMLQSENSTDAQLRDSIPTGKKPKRAPSLRLLGSNDVVPTAETISQSKRSSGTAKPVFLGEMSSPRSKLDLLLDAADDFLADNSEDDLLNELDAAGSSLDVPPEPKKTICFEDDDDDSDPIKELIDFVESESTPLEKLLGLEAPRNSPVSPRSATNTPEAPLSPQEPQTINNIRPLRNDSTPARPGMSVISPTALPTRTTSTPIHNRTTKNTTDSSSLHTHRRSIFSRKKSEKKLDREPKKPEEEKEKKKKRFGRKKPKTKNQGAPATSALDQPGVTWGKSKDAEAILEKLRSEGMDL